MKILITNDDGILAPGIIPLVSWARQLGEVTVVAPKVEQSGKSHAIEFVKPIEIKRVDPFHGIEAYAMDSTPADCVRFGIMGLGRKYDLVLSGINRGVNLGVDMIYSGTVAAIFEAAYWKHRAIAFSAYPGADAAAGAELDRIYKYIKVNGLFDVNDIYNVNIPHTPRGIRITKQGSPYFSDGFVRLDGEDDMYLQTGEHIPDEAPEDSLRDTVALADGYISITPLTLCRTNMEAFGRLREIEE